jgi:UDP-N-acetylmuramate--alanine ligase
MENLLTVMRTDSRNPASEGESVSFPFHAGLASSSAAPVSRFSGRRVHFVGIGGSGMSGLARMLLDRGAIVSGSEPHPNPQTADLARRGVTISHEQTGGLLSPEIDLVVRTAAVKDDNLEYQAAGALGLKTIKYAQLLGEVMQECFGVAVAGTHGKSTTTAMISYALLNCGADPSFVIGGTVPQLGGGSRSGLGRAFVAEACEFDRSFHNLRPTVAIITNIEADHLDCYKSLDAIIESFRAFANLVPPGGLILANGNDANVARAIEGLSPAVQTITLDRPATWSTRTTGVEGGCYRGEVLHNGKLVARLRLSVAGEHNLYNATVAVAACAACGVDPARAADAVGGFTGVDRRMTEVGRFNGAVVADDYGHHPTEIRATLKALREKYKPNRLFCVFQPHQHSRTRFLLDEFATSFEAADETILPEIYFVRDSEDERSRVCAADLAGRIERNGQRARHLPEFSAIAQYLRGVLRDGDLAVTMGAGNVWEIGHDVVSRQ